MITQRAVRAMFYELLRQNTGSWIDDISTPVLDSDQDSEDYAWLGMVPQMSEKKGEKSFSQLREESWNVKNVQYQGGIAFPKKHILYDKTGQVQIRIQGLAARERAHWVGLISTLLINGESTVCYDDQFFFDTDHSEGDSGTQDNDITYNVATATAPTVTEMIDAILNSIEKMIAFKDDKGEYKNEDLKDFIIVTGTSFMPAGLKALTQTNVGGGDTNVLMQQDSYRLRLVSSPRFNSWTTKFATFATEGNQSPIIRQQRIPNNGGAEIGSTGIEMQSLWLDSEHCIKNDECLMSIEAERAAAYGDWSKAMLTTLT